MNATNASKMQNQQSWQKLEVTHNKHRCGGVLKQMCWLKEDGVFWQLQPHQWQSCRKYSGGFASMSSALGWIRFCSSFKNSISQNAELFILFSHPVCRFKCSCVPACVCARMWGGVGVLGGVFFFFLSLSLQQTMQENTVWGMLKSHFHR